MTAERAGVKETRRFSGLDLVFVDGVLAMRRTVDLEEMWPTVRKRRSKHRSVVRLAMSYRGAALKSKSVRAGVPKRYRERGSSSGAAGRITLSSAWLGMKV